MKKTADIIKKLFQRWAINAMGAMALGLFSSLIIGLIISQLSTIPGLGILGEFSKVIGAASPVVGAAIGVAIAAGLKMKPLVVYSSAATGAFGYSVGGPVGAYIAALAGAEIGNWLAAKKWVSSVSIVVLPLVTIISGCIFGQLVGGPVSHFMTWMGSVVNSATELSPIPMGIAVAVIIGLCLTAPISSAAICIALQLNGLAAGAAVVGCCAQMVGFAVASFPENRWGGLIAQGLGTSMLQVPNILRRPQIWVPPTLASAILGPISTKVLAMTNIPSGAGMGTSGLVGQFGAWSAMGATMSTGMFFLQIITMHFLLPAALTLVFAWIMRRQGWIKFGDMKLNLGE